MYGIAVAGGIPTSPTPGTNYLVVTYELNMHIYESLIKIYMYGYTDISLRTLISEIIIRDHFAELHVLPCSLVLSKLIRKFQ